MRSALRLFVEQGYAAATIQSVADAANVSVETIYKRFGNKQNLLRAAIRLTVVEDPGSDDFVARFLQLPPLRNVRATNDQRAQLRMLAAFSRTRLEQSGPIHLMLRSAVADHTELDEILAADHAVRRASQRALIDLLTANGPLRLPAEEAAETYSALANPDLYLLLTTHHGWRPERYEQWLADTLMRLLLP